MKMKISLLYLASVNLRGFEQPVTHFVGQTPEYAFLFLWLLVLLRLSFFFLCVLFLLNHVVDVGIIAVEVGIVTLLLLTGDLLTHASLPGLSDDLGLNHLALFGQLRALLNDIC